MLRRFLLATVLLVTASCAPAEPRAGAAGHTARVVTLGPSVTEVAWLLGAGDRLVGRSRWDRWPEGVQGVPEVGDAIRPSVERIVATGADLVVIYPAGDNAPAIEALTRAGIRVVALRVDRINDFLLAVDSLGTLLGARPRADSISGALRATLDSVRRLAAPSPRPRVYVPVWMDPPMTVGAGSFLSELLDIAGATNIYADRPEPSFTVAFEDVVRRDPDLLLTTPASWQRLQETAPWATLRAVREQRLLLLDTLRMSQPSTRMGEAARALSLEVRRGPR
jgi:ABC-type Fe3+-hydroxamate transport system substrate-binding protein